MKNRTIVVASMLVFLASALSLHAQAPAAPSSKVGLVNIQGAIANTAEGKKVLADLQMKYAPRQQDIQKKQQDIQSEQDQMQKQANTLSEEEQARMSREVEEKQKVLKRELEDAQADFGRDRDEAINRIGQKMVQVIDAYAQQNGFSLVIDDAQIPVYYYSKEIEITAEIIKRYDAANPVAGAAPAKAPTPPAAPAPKPKP
jgi:outer membrane protein